MTRTKTQTDLQVLGHALEIVHESGIRGLTFSHLATRSGLAAPTLVQRFSNKSTLTRLTLLYAWDVLESHTNDLATAAPKTAEGATELLLALSRQYAGPDSVANGLLLLREDVLDAELRARGQAWERQLAAALNSCLGSSPEDEVGFALAAYWQGCVLWWAYRAAPPLEEDLTRRLIGFLTLIGRYGDPVTDGE